MKNFEKIQDLKLLISDIKPKPFVLITGPENTGKTFIFKNFNKVCPFLS